MSWWNVTGTSPRGQRLLKFEGAFLQSGIQAVPAKIVGLQEQMHMLRTSADHTAPWLGSGMDHAIVTASRGHEALNFHILNHGRSNQAMNMHTSSPIAHSCWTPSSHN